MLRVTKQADYGIVLLTWMAMQPTESLHNARDLARTAGLPAPMVSKILKALARGGVLVSHRGTKGGYQLARSPESITVIEIIQALEGPVAITECIGTAPSTCTVEQLCPIRVSWQRINNAIHQALNDVTLDELIHPTPAPAVRENHPAQAAIPGV